MAEMFFNQLATKSGTIDLFFESGGLSRTNGTIVFDPPQPNWLPNDSPKLGVESHSFRETPALLSDPP